MPAKEVPLPKRVRVVVMGEEYYLKATEDEGYLVALAEELDRRMRLVADATPGLPPLRMAVLAALNLTDELVKVRRDYQSLVDLIEEGERAQ